MATKRKDKSRVVLKTGEVQRKCSYGTSWLLKSKIGVQVSGIFALNLADNDKPLGARL